MTTVTLEEAQSRLAELIAAMDPGDQILITQQDCPVARLVVEPPRLRKPRKPGSTVGELTIVEDDGSHLEDFREYMP